MKFFLLITLFTYHLVADNYYINISPITPEIKKRIIKGNAWKENCPVQLENLRYVRVSHWNFKGDRTIGELIVHRDVTKSINSIFKELYDIKYPIRQMKLVSDFNGNDWQSIEADNTSAHNCRPITGNKNKWSNHAYGKAIDINPIENPYISRTGYISHAASAKYRKRAHHSSIDLVDRAVILKKDQATMIFEKYGWTWGGDWEPVKDYQHFEYIKN